MFPKLHVQPWSSGDPYLVNPILLDQVPLNVIVICSKTFKICRKLAILSKSRSNQLILVLEDSLCPKVFKLYPLLKKDNESLKINTSQDSLMTPSSLSWTRIWDCVWWWIRRVTTSWKKVWPRSTSVHEDHPKDGLSSSWHRHENRLQSWTIPHSSEMSSTEEQQQEDGDDDHKKQDQDEDELQAVKFCLVILLVWCS